MAAELSVAIKALLTGLGKPQEFGERFTRIPIDSVRCYRVQTLADTAEELDLGNISPAGLVLIHAVDNALSVDSSYSSSFSAELYIGEGEFALFQPSGTVYVKNRVAGETCTYEYMVI